VPGLSFLSPWFLAGVAAVGLPILLHLFARQAAQEVSFGATRFVPPAPVEFVKRRRVTDLLLLLLRCLALALLALAFARPYFADAAGGAAAPVTLVALDTSYSMAAPDTWRAAQAEAVRAVDDAPAGGRVGVLTFDESGRVVLPPSADRDAARRAIGQLRPGAGATSFAAAVAPALQAFEGRAGVLIIVTDRQRAGLTGELRVPDSTQVRFVPVPPARENLAVADVTRSGAAIAVTAVNGGLADRATEVSLRIDGTPVARQPVTLAAGAAATVRFDRAGRERGVATVSLADPLGLPADDERTLVLDPPPGIDALSIVAAAGTASNGFYVRRALEAAPRSQPVSVRELVLPSADWPSGEGGTPDVILLLATRGLGRDARQRLAAAVESGAGLLVAAGPDVDAGALAEVFANGPLLRVEQLGPMAAPLALAPVEVRHAVFASYLDRAAAFSRVRFDRAVRIAADAPARVVAAFDNGLPALTEHVAGKGRVLLLASDLDARWNQWPLSPTFVPFVRDAVGYLAQKPLEPQEYLVGQAPSAVAPTPGVHVLASGRRVAVNVDPRESSLDLAEEAELAALVRVEPAGAEPPAQRAGVAQEARQSLWRYLLLGMAAVLVGESLVSARQALCG
jgi:hypothetical protein